MRVLPVIERELRASARQSFTYSLRVLAVLALLIVLGLFAVDRSFGPEIGGALFGALHCTLLVAIWVLVPLATADCISRERREGTLPLLFLTVLKPRHIVCAKGLAHGLRAFTLWFAVLPLLAIPLVAGGVGWPELVMSALVNFSAVCLATAAGLIASSLARSWTRALAIALVVAFWLLVSFSIVLPILVVGGSGMTPQRFLWKTQFYSGGGPGVGIAFSANWNGAWQRWLSGFSGGPWPLLRGYFLCALLSLLVLVLAILAAAWRVKRVWREEPLSARIQWLQGKLFTPIILRPVLHRWLRWHLQRNPIGWLEQRSWSGRLVVWSWFAIMVCIYSSLFSNLSVYQQDFHGFQSLLASLLAGSIALSAAGSFRRERESGVLELLLVAPLREWQIIGGRVRGLWVQFLPAMVLLCSVWLYCATFMTSSNELGSVLVYGTAFAALPVIGLYFSLAQTNYIASLIWTLLIGVVVPAVIGKIASFWFEPISRPTGYEPALAGLLLPCFVQAALALLLAWRLHHRLRYRQFALERKGN